jgi:hypothetical protein
LDWVALALCLGLGACWLLRALRGQGLLVVAVVTGVYLSAMAPGLMAVGWFVLCAGGDCL